MVRKPIVLSLLYAFEVEPVLMVHNVGLFLSEFKIQRDINFVYGIMLKNIQISI